MVLFWLGTCRDLYFVMLFLLVVEQIPGSDLLHDITRKVVITITVCLVAVKLLQPIFESSNGGSVRGPRRQKKKRTEGAMQL